MGNAVKYSSRRCRSRRVAKDYRARGLSLLETMIALAILLIALAGVTIPFLLSVSQTEAQGNVATCATELSQDKMEGLMAVTFNDPGLGGAMGASSTVGAVPPTAPAAGYVDYLDETGAATTAPGFYTRQWSISTDATATLKTITIVVTANQRVGAVGIAPSTTLVSIKSSACAIAVSPCPEW
jgi:prepilin-type N-terminal cleavage/methylation domain-containing protein